MQKSNAWADLVREKQYEIVIPAQIRNTGRLTGAVFFEFGETECLTLYNSKYLYFLEIVDAHVAKYSSFSIHDIGSIISIIKGYLLITTLNQKLWLLQVKKVQKIIQKPRPDNTDKQAQKIEQKLQEKGKQATQKILTVESFLKQVVYHSYFLRQVTQNMIELFISCPFEKNTRIIYVYQFTVNQKVGGMGFTVDKNMKIVGSSRKQLYASKNYFDPGQNSIIKLKNFSDSNFITKKIQQEYLYIFPICKTQEYYCLNKNYEIINTQIQNDRKSVKQQLKGFSLEYGISHMNFVLLQHTDNKVGLFSIEEGGKIKSLGTEKKQYRWQICFNGRLVGINNNSHTVKVTKQLYRKQQKSSSPSEQSQSNSDLTLQTNIKLEKQPIKQQSAELSPSEVQQNNKKPQIESKQGIPKQSQKTDKPLKNQEPKSENINKQVKDQQPEPSKIKNGFKPSKIISRKDLSKEQKQSSAVPDKKQDAAPNKQEANQQQKKDNVPQSEVAKQQIVPPMDNKQKNIIQQQAQKIQSSSQKSESLNKQQKVEEFRADPQVQSKSKSPFEKKNNAIDNAPSIMIPNISYDKVFGAHLQLPPKINTPLFSKPSAKQQEQKPIQNPFHKKSESLVVNNDGTTKIIDTKQSSSNQQQKQKSPMRKMSFKKQQSPKKIQKQINCCNHFQQTKLSYNNFSKKIQNLQNVTNQIFKNLDNTTEQIKSEIKQSIQKGQAQILQTNQQKVIKTLKSSVQLSMNDYFARKLTPKVNDYFKSVMADSKKIYDTTLKFYNDKKKQSIISLQNHFQQQQHLVSQIRLMTTDMLTCVQNTINEGQQNHAILLKQWQKISSGVNAKLDANLESLENHTHSRSASQRQHILDSLAEIKDSIDIQNSQIQSQKQEMKEKQKKQQKQTKKKSNSSSQKQQKVRQKLKKKTKAMKTREQGNYYGGTAYGGGYYQY